MTITENKIPLVGTDGLKLDTTRVTQTDGTVVEREAMVIVDPETLANRAGVVGDVLGRGEYGIVTRDIYSEQILASLGSLIKEMKRVRNVLETAFDLEGLNDG